MRTFSTVLATSLLFSSLSVAAQNGQEAVKVVVAPGSIADFTEADKSPEAIKKGLQALAKTRTAYRAAPAMTESIEINVKSPMGGQTMKVVSAYEVDRFRIQVVGQIDVTGVDNQIYMSMPEVAPDRYMSGTVENGQVIDAISALTDGGGLPDPAVPFRLGKAEMEIEKIPALLSLGAMQNVAIKGFRSTPSGSQILLQGEGGSGVVSLNGKNDLVARMDLTVTPPGMPAEMALSLQLVIDAEVMKTLPKKIAFVTEGKTRVDNVNALLPEQPTLPQGGLKVGQDAPAFDLMTLSGEKVSLASLAGKVVVLDFWATWCGPCRAAMPAMNELAMWAKSEGDSVKVFAVNVGETKEKASGYWDAQKFVFPCLLDTRNVAAMAYGASSIPLTVVIGPDGKVAEVEVGLNFNPQDKAGVTKHLDLWKKTLTGLAAGKG
jgi:thiol-disulfide isomerase/thioredoxin